MRLAGATWGRIFGQVQCDWLGWAERQQFRVGPPAGPETGCVSPSAPFRRRRCVVGLRIRFQGGARAGEVVEFADGTELIVIGRDAERSQVAFPPDETKVGREHCALKRVLGRYRVQLNRDNLVLIDGQPAIDDQELGNTADLQLGRGGPTLVVETVRTSGLVPTEGQGDAGPGKATMLRQTQRTAKTGRFIGAAAVVLLVAAVIAVYFAFRKRDVEQEGDRARTDRAVKAVKKGVGELKRKADRPTLAAHLQKARPSVYLVVPRFVQGAETSYGTAWVAGKGILGTNAHVAEVFSRRGKLVENCEAYGLLKDVLVRSNASEPKTLRVASVRIHPGYKAFARVWVECRPVLSGVWGAAEVAQPAGLACDVALLYVDEKEADQLERPLPLASANELGKLKPTDPVGYVGYPRERIPAVNLKRPTPENQSGTLSGITDYFGVDAKDDQRGRLGRLVRHSLPATGGASGSPILNAQGRVIAVLNAGSVFEFRRGAKKDRIPLAAGVNFGQRVDLLRELIDLDDEALGERQKERTKQWRKRIADVLDSLDATQRRGLAYKSARDWERTLRSDSGDKARFKSKEIMRRTAVLRAGGDAGKAASVVAAVLLKAGPCMVLALCQDDSAVDLTVSETAGPGKGRRHVGKGHPKAGWFRSAQFEVGAKTSIEAAVVGTKAGTAVDLLILQTDQEGITPDERFLERVSSWEQSVTSSKGQEIKAKQMHRSSGVLPAKLDDGGTAAVKTEVALPQQGRYLIVAVGPNAEDVDLRVRDVTGGKDKTLGSHTGPDPAPVVHVHVDAKATIEVTVDSEQPAAKYELRVYRAVPANGSQTQPTGGREAR